MRSAVNIFLEKSILSMSPIGLRRDLLNRSNVITTSNQVKSASSLVENMSVSLITA
jgi:hypothetical protein